MDFIISFIWFQIVIEIEKTKHWWMTIDLRVIWRSSSDVMTSIWRHWGKSSLYKVFQIDLRVWRQQQPLQRQQGSESIITSYWCLKIFETYCIMSGSLWERLKTSAGRGTAPTKPGQAVVALAPVITRAVSEVNHQKVQLTLGANKGQLSLSLVIITQLPSLVVTSCS